MSSVVDAAATLNPTECSVISIECVRTETKSITLHLLSSGQPAAELVDRLKLQFLVEATVMSRFSTPFVVDAAFVRCNRTAVL